MQAQTIQTTTNQGMPITQICDGTNDFDPTVPCQPHSRVECQDCFDQFIDTHNCKHGLKLRVSHNHDCLNCLEDELTETNALMNALPPNADPDERQQLEWDHGFLTVNIARLKSSTTTEGLPWEKEKPILDRKIKAIVNAFFKEHAGSPKQFQLCYQSPLYHGMTLTRGGNFAIFPFDEYPDDYRYGGCTFTGEWGQEDAHNTIYRAVWELSILPLTIPAN